MNKGKITAVSCILALMMIASVMTVGAVEIKTYSENLSVYYNQENVYANSVNQPIIINDRTMVQIKPIFDLMGFSAEYNDAEKKATFTNAAQTLKYAFVAEDSNIYKYEGTSEKQIVKTLDVPATIYNNTFYVPLRGFCEVFGMDIDWIDSERKVTVSGGQIDPRSFSNFIGEWSNITGMYLAQLVNVNVDILSVDEANKTITLKYRYDMGASGIWDGGSVSYGAPVTVGYTDKNVKIEVKNDGYTHDYEEFNALITDPISIMGNADKVDSIIGNNDEALCKIRLIVPGNGNMYYTPSATATTISCSDSEICEKIN